MVFVLAQVSSAGQFGIIGLLITMVVVGIRQEPPAEEMHSRAPGLMAAFVRRLLGVSLRRP